MPAPDAIKSLVERFERIHEQYRSSKYNQTQVRHDKMGSLVARILELHKQAPPDLRSPSPNSANLERASGRGRTPQEQEMVKREIESTDREIDELVYEFYGLSEDEIRVVEGG